LKIIAPLSLKNMKSDVLKVKAMYWLGATDSTCNKKFKWCPTYEPLEISNYKWISGQPNYLLAIEHCILLTSDDSIGLFMLPPNFGFNDAECFSKYGYICEERQ
jgi:hypothetical protein